MLKKTISRILLAFLFFSFLLVQVGDGNAEAQTFYLKDYVLGNSYDPSNRNFSWKASKYCPYNWSIKINRINTLGGAIELRASPVTKPDCRRIYRITWAFSKDIRTVSCGEKIFIDVTNMPISKDDCGIFVWEGDNNPSSITILTEGESGLVHEIRSKDPRAAYRGYVFQHYPGQFVQGEPSAYQAKVKEQHLHHARLELVVCSRADMAKNANGGSFTFRIGNRGISFDVVYLYSKTPGRVRAECQTFSNPMIQGYRLDRCLKWGQQCGEPAATAWCQTQGFERATEWNIAQNVPPTYVLGDRQVCNQQNCDGFSRITCCNGPTKGLDLNNYCGKKFGSNFRSRNPSGGCHTWICTDRQVSYGMDINEACRMHNMVRNTEH